MLKKIILVFCLGIGELTWAKEDQIDPIDPKIAAIVGVGGGVIFTVAYLVGRESNAAKIERAQKQYLSNTLKQVFAMIKTREQLKVAVSGIEKFYSKVDFKLLHCEVQKSCDELEARYGSPFKPWNWTEPMRIAHTEIHEHGERLLIFEMMARWQSFIALEKGVAPSLELIHEFVQGQSLYPLFETERQLVRDINIIRSMDHSSFACYRLLDQTLTDTLAAMRRTEAFSQEKQKMEAARQQERLVLAAEEQARAATAQANNVAQRTNIEAQKLALERKKFEAERQKFEAEQKAAADKEAAAQDNLCRERDHVVVQPKVNRSFGK